MGCRIETVSNFKCEGGRAPLKKEILYLKHAMRAKGLTSPQCEHIVSEKYVLAPLNSRAGHLHTPSKIGEIHTAEQLPHGRDDRSIGVRERRRLSRG